MPEVAANATHATLVCWNKAQGDRVEVGDSIADVETDKAVVELPVEQAGVIGKLLVPNGTEVPVGEPIALLLQDGETLHAVESVAAFASGQPAPVTDLSVPQSETQLSPQSAPQSTPTKHGRIFSSPAARLLAREQGINLQDVVGNGPNGRITKHDVVCHAASVQAGSEVRVETSAEAPILAPVASAFPPNLAAPPQGLGEPPARVCTPSPTRRTIAKRLSQSKREVPHFYLRTRCDVGALLAAREQINVGRVDSVSLNDFVIRACAVALVHVPQMNVSWREDGIYEFSRADVSVAVDTPNGLLTPIVHDASNKTLSAISAQMRSLVQAAREGRLQPSQFQGGTFSVSNLGMLGVTDFDAIINPPQAGILAVGAVQSVPLIRDGVVQPGQVMDVVLSVDHRAVDGAVAARWLAAFRALIEQPVTMLV